MKKISGSKPYAIGFCLSIALTLLAFFVVFDQTGANNNSYNITSLRLLIMLLVVAQLIVQALFFLHLGKENKPKWNQITFSFTIMVVLIVVVGSLWIMSNLDKYHGHVPTSSETSQNKMIDGEGIRN